MILQENGTVLAACDAHRVAWELCVRRLDSINTTIHNKAPLLLIVLNETHRMGAEIALLVAATCIATGNQLLADRTYDWMRRQGWHRRERDNR